MATLAELLSTARSAAGLETPKPPEDTEPTRERPRNLTGPLDALLQPFQQEATDPFALALRLMAQQPRGRGLDALAPGGAGPSVSASGYTAGNALLPGSPLLQTRRGATLQGAALESLITAARRYDLLPKARELGLIGPQATYRTPEEQAALYRAKPGVAAPPGQSYHQQGLAIDLPAQLQTPEFEALLRRLGWNQFSPQGEPWHWSYGVTG